MNNKDKLALMEIMDKYDADHDAGPEAPVNWQIIRLMSVIKNMDETIEALKEEVVRLDEKVNR